MVVVGPKENENILFILIFQTWKNENKLAVYYKNDHAFMYVVSPKIISVIMIILPFIFLQ